MKKDDQQLDDLFKEAHDNQAFQYQSDYFKEVEKTLYPSSPNRLMAAWVALVALFLTGMAIPFIHTSDSSILEVAKTHTPILKNKLSSAAVAKKEGLRETKFIPDYPILAISESSKAELENKPTIYSNQTSAQYPNSESVNRRLAEYLTDGKQNNVLKYDFVPPTVSGLDIVEKEEIHKGTIGRLMFADLSRVHFSPATYIPTPFVRPFTNRSKGIFVTAAASLGTVYANNERSYAKSIGLGAGYSSTKGAWGWSFALMGEILKTNIRFSESTKHYSYNVTYFENVLDYSTFYKIDIPVWGHFKTGKHIINAGFALTQVFQSQLNYTYRVNGEVMRDEIIYGEKQGINSTQLLLQAGYGLHLTRRLVLGANISYSLNPMIQTNKNTSCKVSPLSGQLYLRHNIKR